MERSWRVLAASVGSVAAQFLFGHFEVKETRDAWWCLVINLGRVFDLELPLDQAAAGYQAINQRRAVKVLLCP